MSLFNRKNNNNDTQQQQQDDDNSIYSNTSSMMSTSSRMSKIPNAVKSSMKYLVRRSNKNSSKSNNKEVLEQPSSSSTTNKLKRHTSTLVHFGNLFNRQTKDKSVMPTSTTSSTLYQKSIDPSLADIKSKRRNSSVVSLATRFLHTTSNNKDSTLQHHEDDEISSSKPTMESTTTTTGSELLESQVVEEYLVEEQCDSKSEITYKPKREEPWTRQRAKSCQDNKTPMLRQLASKGSSNDLPPPPPQTHGDTLYNTTNKLTTPSMTSDLPFFKGLVTTTLTTLHTRLTNECDRALSSILLVDGQQLPQEQLLSIISDLRKMTEMVNWEAEDQKKQVKDQLNDIEQAVTHEKLTIISVRDHVSTMKQLMNQCICQYYKVVEKAMVIPAKGYKIEGKNKYADDLVIIEKDPVDYSTWTIDHKDPNAHWYRTYFMDAADRVVTFFGYHPTTGDPIIISIKVEENTSTSTNRQFRIIYRTKKDQDQRKVILDSFLLNAPTNTSAEEEGDKEEIEDTTWKSIIESTFSIPYHQFQKMSGDTLISSGLQDDLLRLDENSLHIRYKFGVLLVKEGQTKEEEWFSNESNPEFESFLDIIGKRVNLEGYTGWAAGLDTKSGDSGEYTYTNVWNENILAYHVSTLIPSRPGDKQQIQRKRHIGNDIVCIVFVQGNQPFNPAAIKSQFLHVFIVVHGEVCNNNVKSWRVEIVSIKDVPTFGPPLPQVFYDPKELEQFLLAKLVNAEYAAFKSPKFSIPMNRAREGIFSNLVERGCKILSATPNDTISMTGSSSATAASGSSSSSSTSASSPRKLLFHTKSASTSSSSQSSTSGGVIPSPSKSSQAIREIGRRRSAQDLAALDDTKKTFGGKKFNEGLTKTSTTTTTSTITTRSHSEQDLLRMTQGNSNNGKSNTGFRHRAHHLLSSIPRFTNNSSNSSSSTS